MKVSVINAKNGKKEGIIDWLSKQRTSEAVQVKVISRRHLKSGWYDFKRSITYEM